MIENVKEISHQVGRRSTADFVQKLGVANLLPHTSPFDPGYDPVTLQSHLEQSGHLISNLKISMSCWLIANEDSTRQKFQAARRLGVPTVTGGGPFEIAVSQGRLDDFLDLCADVGADRIECGEGFTDMPLQPKEAIRMAEDRGLAVQFEMGKKRGGTFESDTVKALIAQGAKWLDAGAEQIVVEGRESARNVGLFDEHGQLNRHFADRFVDAFGMAQLVYEAPTKESQFALLNHFGPKVHLCNVRLEELLRVEIYRRGLHADAFGVSKLTPVAPRSRTA